MIKDIGKSVRAKLLNITKQQKTQFQIVFIRYVYEKFVYMN